MELTTMSMTDTTPPRRVTGGFGKVSGPAATGDDMIWKEDNASASGNNGLGHLSEGRGGVPEGLREEAGRLEWEVRPPYGDPAAVSPASLRSRTAAAGRATIG